MIFHSHIVNPSITASAAEMNGGNYPLAFSVESFLDIFSDVKAFNISAYAFIDSSSNRNIGTSVLNQLDLLQTVGKDKIYNLDANTIRSIEPISKLTSLGATPVNHPNTLIDYPFHRAGNQNGSVIIDFGKSILSNGLIYPWISIEFSNGFTSQRIGTIVGNIFFTPFGSIPIYSGPADLGNAVGSAGGILRISERYSSLRSASLSAQVGSSLILEAFSPLENLNQYTKAYFGASQSRISSERNRLIIPIPDKAKSGPVRIEGTSPQFDSFLTYQEFIFA